MQVQDVNNRSQSPRPAGWSAWQWWLWQRLNRREARLQRWAEQLDREEAALILSEQALAAERRWYQHHLEQS